MLLLKSNLSYRKMLSWNPSILNIEQSYVCPESRKYFAETAAYVRSRTATQVNIIIYYL